MPQDIGHHGDGSGWLDPARVAGLEALAQQTGPIASELRDLRARRIWSAWGNSHYTPTFTRMSGAEIAAHLARDQDHIGAGAVASWRLFGLYINGHALPQAHELCPLTMRAVAAVPGMVNAGFSCLEAGYRLRPHVGHNPRLRRAHLGLEVPAGDCALRVDGEARRWEVGRILLFDDTHLHDAWNLTAEHRVVLIVDLASDRMRAT